MARPRKSAAVKAAEGNRGKRDIVPEAVLHGTPELPPGLHDSAAEHFRFLAAEFGGAGVLKRADGPALAKLARLWQRYWELDEAGDIDLSLKVASAWDRAASRLGLSPVDRSRLLVPKAESSDPTEDKYFRVTG